LWLRIFLFLNLTVVVVVAASFLAPEEMPLASAPLLLGCLVGGWAMLRLDGRRPGALGFYLSPGIVKESLCGLGLGVCVGGAVVAGMVVLGALRWVPDAGSALGYVKEGGAALWFFSLPAAGEEALMRGYLFQALAEVWGGSWALWVTSVLFGMLHLGNPNTSWIGLANILVAGLFLGVIYLKTASLWWATGAHLGWNWTHGFLFDLPVSGLELLDAPLLEPLTRGPDWLSGGAFGPEGSVLSTLILLSATGVLWRTSWLRPGERAREVRPLMQAGQASGPSSVPEEGAGGNGDFGREK
jgi:membrane protease YdiL (CAAX protease family)